uniref:Uncharacterized protein n=1 Tax=Globodera rostochiensis TaxID=31243 RepID=A0A914HT67_GLORO
MTEEFDVCNAECKSKCSALKRRPLGSNCYVKLRSQETSPMLNKYRERKQKEKRTQTSREIYALLKQFSTLDQLQKQAVLNDLDIDKKSAPSKRKAAAVDCISQRLEPLFHIVTAMNSAVDHVAQKVQT